MTWSKFGTLAISLLIAIPLTWVLAKLLTKLLTHWHVWVIKRKTLAGATPAQLRGAYSIGVPWKRWVLPALANTAVLGLVFKHAENLQSSGNNVISLLFGMFGTVMFAWPICLVSDALRWHLFWRRWTICPTMALVAVSFSFLAWLALPKSETGFKSVFDVFYYGGCVIFAPTIVFGFVFTILYRDDA